MRLVILSNKFNPIFIGETFGVKNQFQAFFEQTSNFLSTFWDEKFLPFCGETTDPHDDLAGHDFMVFSKTSL